MTEPALHAPFLERAGNDDAGADSQLALGAFLTLRAVDALSRDPANHEALEYQLQALDEFQATLPEGQERDYQQAVANGLKAGLAGDFNALWSGLLQYEDYLEGAFRLAEAHDVVNTGCQCSAQHEPAMLPVMELRRGRPLRMAGRFDEAKAAYTRAGDLATERGDGHTERLSRIGRAIVHMSVGNLPASEALLESVIHDAREADDNDALARASHDLACNHIHRDNPAEAVPLAHQAYQLYESDEMRYRAIGDLGMALGQLGHLTAARDAQEIVAAGPVTTGMRMTALLELLDITAAMQDRVAFERIRREIGGAEDTLPPDWTADFLLKLGRGFCDFEQPQTARGYLERAVAYSSEHGFHQYAFQAEQLLRELDAPRENTPAPEPVDASQFGAQVAEIADELHHLRIT